MHAKRDAHIGVAITTHNRPDLLAVCIEAHRRYAPDWHMPLVVVDDASEPPAQVPEWVTLIRFDRNVGIPRAKNAGIEALMDAGVEHLFLFDDDTRPRGKGWWRPYVASDEPHLSYGFADFADGTPVGDDHLVIGDGNLVSHTAARGCMLYATRQVIEAAGGMDVQFGLGYYEHGDWSNRIHNLGLTTWPYADVRNSDVLIYSADQARLGHGRTVVTRERRAALGPNKALHAHQQSLAVRREYERTVILSGLYITQPDIQRQRHMRRNMIRRYINSLGHEPHVVFTDVPKLPNSVHRPQRMVAGWQRFFDEYDWLEDHPEIRWVWLTDATDVVLLNHPWNLDHDTLYVGSEPTNVGCKWMRDRHPHMTHWLNLHADETLLNCGLIGGDRDTIMRFLHEMCDMYDPGTPIEMGAFNQVARRFHYVTGREVHTPFRKWATDDPLARWAHK